MKLTPTNILFILAVLVIVVVCVDTCNSQIADFSGGMNTWDSWPKPNEFFQMRNFVLDDPRGGATVRNGYHAITTDLSAHTRHRSIFGYKFLANDIYLFRVLQRDTVTNYCDMYVSTESGYDTSGAKLFEHIYPSSGSWVGWLGNQFYFNGRQSSVMIVDGPDDMKASTMLPPAPGQAITVPINQTGNLRGEYIYAILGEVPCVGANTSTRPGPFSLPVKTEGEMVRLTGFYPITKDSACAAVASGTNVTFKILRTKANKFTPGDSVWVIQTYDRPNGSTDTIVYIDNIPDASLSADSTGGYPFWGTVKQTWDQVRIGANPRWVWGGDQYNDTYALGSMSLIDTDAGTSTDTVLGATFGCVTGGSPCSHHFENWYTYTLLDKITGIESDTACILSVFIPVTGSVNNFDLGVPAPPSDRYHRIIYKMHYVADSVRGSKLNDEEFVSLHNQTFYALDTIVEDGFYEFRDTIQAELVELYNGTYDRAVPGRHFNGGLTHEARMYTWDDHRLYFSKTDTTEFPQFNNLAFDLDDGDPIIWVMSYEGMIVVYKTNSVWVLYTSDGSIYDRQKASFGIGAIASNSLARYRGSNIFLGKLGVTSESDGEYRDRRLGREFISDPIRNVLLRPVSTMTNAVGFILGDRYYLTYPGTDSTFVYHFKTGGWSIFDFDFSEATLYDTISNQSYMNLTNWYFTKDDDNLLYVFDEADTTDNGSDFSATLEKRQVARDPWTQQLLNQVLLQVNSETAMASQTDSVIVGFTNEVGDTLYSTMVDSLARKYRRIPVVSTDNRLFHHLNMKIVAPNRLNLTIKALELDITPAGIK